MTAAAWRELQSQAGTARRAGRLAEAEALLRQALAVAQAESSSVRAGLYNALADVHRRAHQKSEAVDAARRGLALRREAQEGPALVGNDLMMLSMTLDEAGQVAEALACAREALLLYRKALGEDHGEVKYVADSVARLERTVRVGSN